MPGIRTPPERACKQPHSAFAAVQMGSDDDAIAAVALTRSLPGLLQRDYEFANYVKAAENIETRQSGTTS